jgi:tetratricopeptide (TPR) repeat protein
LVEIPGANWDARSAPGMLMLPGSAILEDFDEFELARRVATQWFPLTYEVADPQTDAWLAEGLGVFASLNYFQNNLSPADAAEYVERTLVRALSYEGDTPLIKVASLPANSPEYDALAGYKGAFVIRMLEDVMGTEAFREMLAQFDMEFGDRPISTRALVEVSSMRTGQDLTYFFDQWLNSADVPEFDRVFQVYRITDGYEVVGQIEQDLELFRMPIQVEVVTDGEPEFATIIASGRTTDLDIRTERKPRGIIVDPDMRVLRNSPEIRVKVHISRGEDLAGQGQFNQAIAEYEQALDLDRLNSLAFFRMGEAHFELGNVNGALTLFREGLNGNLDPIWIEVWSYINMGKIYDLRQDRERAITEYQKALNTRDDAYGAQGEAQRFIDEPFRGAADIF